MSHWYGGDSYLYQALLGYMHQPVTVETFRGSVRGSLNHVAPDHIIVEMGGNYFFIRTEQIIWFIPQSL